MPMPSITFSCPYCCSTTTCCGPIDSCCFSEDSTVDFVFEFEASGGDCLVDLVISVTGLTFKECDVDGAGQETITWEKIDGDITYTAELTFGGGVTSPTWTVGYEDSSTGCDAFSNGVQFVDDNGSTITVDCCGYNSDSVRAVVDGIGFATEFDGSLTVNNNQCCKDGSADCVEGVPLCEGCCEDDANCQEFSISTITCPDLKVAPTALPAAAALAGWTGGSSGEYYSIKHAECHRLYRYDNIRHDGAAFSAVPTPTILVTNRNAAKSIGPRTPFDTAEGSGIPLDDDPYWDDTCEVGGWDTATETVAIDLADIYACISGTMLVAADTPFTLFVLVEYKRQVRFIHDYGPPATYTFFDEANESDSGYTILKVWIKYC